MRPFRFSSLRHAAIISVPAAKLMAAAAEYKWPARGEDPYPWPKGADAHKVLSERWTKASKKPLGTDADTGAIKKGIIAHIREKNADVREVRWLSPTLAMASAGWYSGPLASASYYYVVQKSKDKWEIVTYYMLSVS